LKIWEIKEISKISEITELSESTSYGNLGNFRNYQIFRNNEAFRGITSKVSEISVISFFGSLNTAARQPFVWFMSVICTFTNPYFS
jgi:hypothetical protein